MNYQLIFFFFWFVFSVTLNQRMPRRSLPTLKMSWLLWKESRHQQQQLLHRLHGRQQFVRKEQVSQTSDHSRIWSQPGKAVPGSHLPTGHIGQLNRAQSKASAGPMYSKFRTPSPSEHSHVVPKHQLRRYPPPPQKKNCLIK